MPHTINGVGTWYYGKVRRFARRGVCENCGSYGVLRSFDTTLYFVVLFVPLVPLRKLRILDECTSCERHSYVKLRDWRRNQEEVIGQVHAAMEADPGHPEHAMSLAVAYAQFQDQEGFREQLPRIERAVKNSAEGQQILAAAHASFGDRGAAEQLLRRAVELDDSPGPRESLALNLCFQKRAREARELLGHLLEPLPAASPAPGPGEDGADAEEGEQEEERGPGLLLVVVESAQAAGEHAFALELLDEIAAVYPEEDLSGLREQSESVSEGYKVRNEAFRPLPAEPDAPGRARLASLIGPGIAALVLLGLAASAQSEAAGRPVYFVNGLSAPYTVEVAGQRLELRPDTPQSLTLPEGTHEIKVLDGPAGLAQQVTIETAFWSRPFTDEFFLVNPDQCALVLREEAIYAAPPRDGAEPRLLTGEALHELEDLDYTFREFPPRLKLPEGSVEVRSRVALVDQGEPQVRAAFVLHYCGQEGLLDWLEQRLRLEPDDLLLLSGYTAVAEPKRTLSFLQEGLSARPLRVDWHRVYQSLRERTSPEHDLESEYERLLAEAPESSEHLYLLGRCTIDPAKAAELLERATRSEPPSPYPFLGLGYQRMAVGQPEDALKLFRDGLRIGAEHLLLPMEEHAMLALGRRKELATRLQQRFGEQPTDLVGALQLVKLLTLLGQPEEAERIQRECLAAHQKQKLDLKEATLVLELARPYASGDLAAFAAACDATRAFEAAVARRDLPAAITAHAVARQEDLDACLALALFAAKSGDDKTRDDVLDLAQRALANTEGGPGDRELLAAARGEGQPDHARLRALAIEVSRKRLLLALIGLRYPEEREAHFALARALNFESSFPQLLLREVLGASK